MGDTKRGGEHGMSEKREPSVEVADALKILHDSCTQNIAFAKNQQWRVTNYLLLIYAALAGIRIRWDTISWPSSSVISVIAALIAFIAAGFGIYMLTELQKSQQRSRQILIRVRSHFPTEFHEARGPEPSHSESFWRYGEIYVFLSVVILIGLVVTLWLLAV